MLTIPISFPKTDESRQMFLNDLKACEADNVLLVCCELFSEGDARENALAELKKDIEYYTDAGFNPGIWTNTLGWGGEPGTRGTDFNKRFKNPVSITSFDGRTMSAVCVLDEEFLSYMERNIADFANTGAKLIILDDDLVLSVRPGFTCACELHKKEFSRRTGRE